MRNLAQLKHHPISEQLVDILCKKTQNISPLFFRILISYHLTKMAGMMRVNVLTHDRGKIPINLYAINLSKSGTGKGHSTNIIEEEILQHFKSEFYDVTYPIISERSLAELAVKRANIKNEDPDVMLLAVEKEFLEAGTMPFAFDSGTTAAVKQMRHKLLMANIGSMNLEIDEIGSNLLGNVDVLGTFLELFDMGKVKQKLTKNTRENWRNEEIDGKTPTNLLLFGTPDKLLNGSKTEEEFDTFLETGYARRSLFGYTTGNIRTTGLTAEEIYDILVDTSLNQDMADIAIQFGKLANVLNYNKSITVSKEVSIIIIKYKMYCEKLAATLHEHEGIRKAELEHRYFKATKLAGTYAFIDEDTCITEDNLYAAICLVEESGKAFGDLLKRERNYVKLAKYIAQIEHEITHVDLTEDLPFYKGSISHKQDLMQLAIAWGYKNHIIIKRNFTDNIEFIMGETLKKTNLEELQFSYSKDISSGYKNTLAPFNKFHKLTSLANHHWINHHTSNGQRNDESIKHGCNMIVLDVDDGVSINIVELLLKDYVYLLHTTKRHTAKHNRFRIIMPINYHLKLNATDFKEFMLNIFSWLPFKVDTATGQRSRKWATHAGSTYSYSKGTTLLNALLFIPKTTKNDERKKINQDYQTLSNVERWFIQNINLGNRNNQILKYALMLVDAGLDKNNVKTKVLELNDKLKKPLTLGEVDSTIMVTVVKNIAKQGD